MTCIKAAFNRAENAFDNLYVLCSPPEIQPHGVIIVSVSWPGLDARKKLDRGARIEKPVERERIVHFDGSRCFALDNLVALMCCVCVCV